jgi:hypothetical protein
VVAVAQDEAGPRCCPPSCETDNSQTVVEADNRPHLPEVQSLRMHRFFDLVFECFHLLSAPLMPSDSASLQLIAFQVIHPVSDTKYSKRLTLT